MTEKEIEILLKNTKKLVLSVIKKYLLPNGYLYIDDIVQETYFRLILAIKKGQFQNKSKISTYLYKIAKNETFRINHKLKKEELKQEKYKENFDQNDFNSFELINQIYDNYQIENIKINNKQNQILSLYLQGFKLKEISEKLNLQLGTVKSNLFRIKLKIKKYNKRGVENE